MKYRNINTGTIWSLEEIKKVHEMYKHETDRSFEETMKDFEEVEMARFTVEYTDSKSGATSSIDTVEAPADYTAEKYILDCEDNADQDWVDMIHAGEVEIHMIEEV